MNIGVPKFHVNCVRSLAILVMYCTPTPLWIYLLHLPDLVPRNAYFHFSGSVVVGLWRLEGGGGYISVFFIVTSDTDKIKLNLNFSINPGERQLVYRSLNIKNVNGQPLQVGGAASCHHLKVI